MCFFNQINVQHLIGVEMEKGIAIVMKSVLERLFVEVTTVLQMKVQVLKFL